MMSEAMLRKFAFSLLRMALRISPSTPVDWGTAMLSELEHIENPRTAVLWAIGCSWTLVRSSMKETLVRKKGLVDESRGVQIRFDAANIFNHPLPIAPSLNINDSNPSFGYIAGKGAQHREFRGLVRLNF